MGIGTLSTDDCINYGLTGVLARSSGLKRDLRLSRHSVYSSYDLVNFRSFIGVNGDTYDRYLIRMLEMGESLNIINFVVSLLLSKYTSQCLTQPTTSVLTSHTLHPTAVLSTYTSMEDLIAHFINNHTGYKVDQNITSIYIESPKGEFGVSLVSNNSSTP